MTRIQRSGLTRGESFGLKGLEIKVQKEHELGRPLTDEEQLQLFSEEIKKLREPRDPIIVEEKELPNYCRKAGNSSAYYPAKKILVRK